MYVWELKFLSLYEFRSHFIIDEIFASWIRGLTGWWIRRSEFHARGRWKRWRWNADTAAISRFSAPDLRPKASVSITNWPSRFVTSTLTCILIITSSSYISCLKHRERWGSDLSLSLYLYSFPFDSSILWARVLAVSSERCSHPPRPHPLRANRTHLRQHHLLWNVSRPTIQIKFHLCSIDCSPFSSYMF